jgi:hypothetical protein
VFGDDCVGKEFYPKFKSMNGREHFTKGVISKLDDILNPPLFTPLDEKFNQPKPSDKLVAAQV